jgi:hypothetical protein
MYEAYIFAVLGFEGRTTVTVKITVFRDVTPCSLEDYYKRFGGTRCVYFQRRRDGGSSEMLCAIYHNS